MRVISFIRDFRVIKVIKVILLCKAVAVTGLFFLFLRVYCYQDCLSF
jgi:hypothetical protein